MQHLCNKKSNAVYRTLIAEIVKEIYAIIRRGVFCVHKPGFLVPGHISGSIHAIMHMYLCMHSCMHACTCILITYLV